MLAVAHMDTTKMSRGETFRSVPLNDVKGWNNIKTSSLVHPLEVNINKYTKQTDAHFSHKWYHLGYVKNM
jgi:hypothetical protein